MESTTYLPVSSKCCPVPDDDSAFAGRTVSDKTRHTNVVEIPVERESLRASGELECNHRSVRDTASGNEHVCCGCGKCRSCLFIYGHREIEIESERVGYDFPVSEYGRIVCDFCAACEHESEKNNCYEYQPLFQVFPSFLMA